MNNYLADKIAEFSLQTAPSFYVQLVGQIVYRRSIQFKEYPSDDAFKSLLSLLREYMYEYLNESPDLLDGMDINEMADDCLQMFIYNSLKAYTD
jgi:hypothetical protein